ncbi:hypothetical protein, partial [Thiolapillus sp.]|uniref:hypothetical protein n=1 Tax=Thiolapillus sp. TaxID=2017437 RepID=UPI003AF5904B
MGLAHPRRADEHQVGALVDEREVQQLADLALGDGGLVAVQACLRPRDRFWDIPVPKIDSAFDNL